MNFKLKSLLLSITTACVLFSCSRDDDSSGTQSLNVSKSSFIESYAKIASANYSDSYNTALEMKTQIDAFLESPTQERLELARAAWVNARDFYGQTEAYREANGPIDNEDLLGTEGQINAWPLDEGYIDYVINSDGTFVQNGLIGDTTFALTEDAIIAKNEEGKDDNISTGWHAIEFLLWGQDLNATADNLNVQDFSISGNRSFEDYTIADFAARRSQYLQIVTNLLISDLNDLNNTWAIGGSYRTDFENLSEDVALGNILNGIGFISNGEVALERIDPAIDEGQENEHSCFSDNTNNDMKANVQGINNIIVGAYTQANGSVLTGVSLIDLVNQENETVANQLDVAAQTTLSRLNTMLGLGQNFDEIVDQETLGSNGPAGQLSSALKQQGVAIAEAANQLGVNITIN